MANLITAEQLDTQQLISGYDYLYLVFNRGFIWPYCKKHMMQLHQDIQKFEDLKIKVVVVCPENMVRVEKFVAKQPLEFDLVADPQHVIADRFKQQVKIFKLGRMPAQIILDKDDKHVFEHYASSMTNIIENNVILSAIKKSKSAVD